MLCDILINMKERKEKAQTKSENYSINQQINSVSAEIKELLDKWLS